MRSGFNDSDDNDGDTPGLHGGPDVFETISGGGIAGDDDGLHRRLRAVRLTTTEQEQGVTQDEFTQEARSTHRRIIAVGHVRLVAEIDETFAGEIRHAIRAVRTGSVMMAVVRLDGLEHRQAADAGIKDADGQIAQVAAIISRHEAGRDIALRMSLGMADGGGDNVIGSKGDDCDEAKQREAEAGGHIRCGRYGRRAGPAG